MVLPVRERIICTARWSAMRRRFPGRQYVYKPSQHLSRYLDVLDRRGSGDCVSIMRSGLVRRAARVAVLAAR